MEVYDKLVLNPHFHITRSKKAVEASKVFVEEIEAVASRRRVYYWTVSPGFIPTQKFPVHIMHYLGTVYKDATTLEKPRLIPLLQQSGDWCGRFYGIDVGTLLTLDTSAQGITVKKATTLDFEA